MSKNSPVLFQLLHDIPRQFGIPSSGGENRISSNVITVLLNIFGQNQPIMQIADEARAFFRSCRVNQIAQAATGSLSRCESSTSKVSSLYDIYNARTL